MGFTLCIQADQDRKHLFRTLSLSILKAKLKVIQHAQELFLNIAEASLWLHYIDLECRSRGNPCLCDLSKNNVSMEGCKD